MNTDTPEIDREEILLIDKPAGISSFGVVAQVRRKLSETAGLIEVRGKDGVVRQKRKKVKVGHTGTLDPFATGLLILLIGKGTKRAGEFLKLDKEYIATIKLGEVSSTGDKEGEITVYHPVKPSLSGTGVQPARRCGCLAPSSSLVSSGHPRKETKLDDNGDEIDLLFTGQGGGDGSMPDSRSRIRDLDDIFIALSLDEVREVIKNFVGEIEQRVPSFSAVKINGQRAYKLAREGKKVEMPVRKVKIYGIEILRYEWPELEIKCQVSSGTYIRALGEDIGEALGVGGYLTSLRRTQVGKYRVEDAVRLEDVVKKWG